MVPQRPFDGESRLRAIQSLNLALFVHAQHKRLLGWIQVKPNYVGRFLKEFRVPRQLECLRPMRLEIVALPDPVDSRFADALSGSQSTATPVRRPVRTYPIGF
jgi:hypothetical protein